LDKRLDNGGGGNQEIHLAEDSVFARTTGKNSYLCDLSQQVLSGVVASTLHVHEVGSYNQDSAKAVSQCCKSFSIGHRYIAKKKLEKNEKVFC